MSLGSCPCPQVDFGCWSVATRDPWRLPAAKGLPREHGGPTAVVCGYPHQHLQVSQTAVPTAQRFSDLASAGPGRFSLLAAFVCLFVCLLVCLFACLFVCWLVGWFVCLRLFLSSFSGSFWFCLFSECAQVFMLTLLLVFSDLFVFRM